MRKDKIIKIIIFISVFTLFACLGSILVSSLANVAVSNRGHLVTADHGGESTTLETFITYSIISEQLRQVTAYNVNDPYQCDSTPCISASMENICEALERGENVCAANFVPMGTILRIILPDDSDILCRVADRMHKKYRDRVDIAMPEDMKDEARHFGLQYLLVQVLEIQ